MHSRCPPKKLFLFREGESIQGDGKKHLMLFSFFFFHMRYIFYLITQYLGYDAGSNK